MSDKLEEELLDPITGDLFSNPISLMCGHTFDKSTIIKWANENNTAVYNCPLCKNKYYKIDIETIKTNRIIMNLVEKMYPNKVKKEIIVVIKKNKEIDKLLEQQKEHIYRWIAMLDFILNKMRDNGICKKDINNTENMNIKLKEWMEIYLSNSVIKQLVNRYMDSIDVKINVIIVDKKISHFEIIIN